MQRANAWRAVITVLLTVLMAVLVVGFLPAIAAGQLGGIEKTLSSSSRTGIQSIERAPLSTQVSGVIREDTVWTQAGSPYIVGGNVAVENGATLTVEPGVEVRFDGHYYLQIDGKLVSEGTPTTPITFTSNLPWPSAGNWGPIRFTDNADDSSVISRTVVMYSEGIYLDRANPTIANSTLLHNNTGIRRFGSCTNCGGPLITGNTIQHSSDWGIYVTNNQGNIPQTVIENNLITDNQNGVSIEGSHVVLQQNDISRNSYRGVELRWWDTQGQVLSNTISANQYGLYACEPGTDIQIAHNDVISNTQTGVELGCNNPPELHHNNLYDNGQYDLRVNVESQHQDQVFVTDNWWGTTDTTLIDERIWDYHDDFTRAQAVYDPYLTEPAQGPSIWPDIDISPISFGLDLYMGDVVTRMLTISNLGASPLEVDITGVAGPPPAWLTTDPISMTLGAGAAGEVMLQIDGSLLVSGTHSTVLHLLSNDPNEGDFAVPISVTVQARPLIHDVQVSNVRDGTFTVSWLTQVPITGSVGYQQEEGVGWGTVTMVPDVRGADFRDDTHYVTAEGLQSETTYRFAVYSGADRDDNGGAYYTVTTGSTLGLPSSDAIFGQVFEQDGGTPAPGTIVYITLSDKDGSGSSGQAALISALTDTDGYWWSNLGNARVISLTTYFDYSPSGDQLTLQAEGAAAGRTRQVVDTADDSPAPAMVLQPFLQFDRTIAFGWNHVALPLRPLDSLLAQDVCQQINEQGGAAVEIDRWYAGGWDGHICDVPFNNFDVELGSDYFIKSDAAGAWTINGFQVMDPVSLSLQIGWNSIGIPHTSLYTAQAVCGEDEALVEVDRWYAGGWDSHVCGYPFNNFDIEQGTGYFVKSNAAVVVTPSLTPTLPALSMVREPEATTERTPATAPAQARNAEVQITDVQITNLRDTSFTVSWMTDRAATGYLEFADGRIVHDVQGKGFVGETHYVVISGLKPETVYRFDVHSGATVDDKAGASYEVSTMPIPDTLPKSDAVYGQVFLSDGVRPAQGAIVYLRLVDTDGKDGAGRSTWMSALVDEHGYWHANLGNARLADGRGYFGYAPDDEVTLMVQVGSGKLTTQSAKVNNLRPAVQMVLD